MRTLIRTNVAAFAVLMLAATMAHADAVLDWNAVVTAMVQEQPPPMQNRFAAITHVAIFEAVNAVTHEYEPYIGGVVAPPGASAEAAAVGAAHAVLRTYFPDRALDLDAARLRSLAAIADGPAKAAGIEVGEAAAARIVAMRANDGAQSRESYLPASSNPGEWQLTPACPASGGVFRHWRNVTPFAIRSPAQFRSAPPPALGDERYAKAYAEVKKVGAADSAARPRDRADVVHFYAGFGDAVLWGTIARQIAAASGSSLSQNARAFALLNMSLNDSGIALVDTKYHYNFWRPETAIRAAVGTPADAASTFVPFIRTPCHPSYPSGHATTSYAAREALERIFGPVGHSITLSTPAVPGVTLRYTSLEQITKDIDDARVYGGIHFRFDQEAGAEQGRRLAAYVFEHQLRCVQASNCDMKRASETANNSPEQRNLEPGAVSTDR